MQESAANTLLEASLGDTWPGVLLLFALFALFFASTLGWGALCGRYLWRQTESALARAGDAFLLGSLVLVASAFLFASAQGLAWASGWAYALLFAPGLWFLRGERWLRGWRAHRVAIAAAALVFFVRALSAAQPARHGDPLLYHLLGPRLWARHGGFYMDPNLPNALLASTWECLYVWPQVFWMSAKPLYGLVEAQLFSQWLHLFLAWLGCALLTMRLFRGATRDSWLSWAGFAALFVAGVQWTAPLAKNDVGIAFWALGAIVYFREGLDEGSWRKVLFSGLFAGLATAGKITAVLTLAPVLGMLALARWRHWFAVATAWVPGAVLGAGPLYLRNFLLSQNPFFPLFPKLFPSRWVSKTWEAHFAQVHPSSPLHALGRLFTRLPELAKETPWAFGAVALLLLALLARRESFARRSVALLVGSVAAYAIFVVTQSLDIELRYLGASLMLLSAGGVCFCLRLTELIPSPRYRQAAAWLILAALLATSRLPLHILRKIWGEPLGVAYVRTQTAGEAKAWVRAHGGPVVVAGDNETYYLTPLEVSVLSEKPEFDTIPKDAGVAAFAKRLCEISRARYLLDVRPEIGAAARLGAAALAPAKVFSAAGANVYALHRLSPECLPGAER